MKSQASASSQPPPSAKPLTAAMDRHRAAPRARADRARPELARTPRACVGRHASAISRCRRRRRRPSRPRRSGSPPAPSRPSPPRERRSIPWRAGVFNALSALGRSMVSVEIPASSATRTNSIVRRFCQDGAQVGNGRSGTVGENRELGSYARRDRVSSGGVAELRRAAERPRERNKTAPIAISSTNDNASG